MNDNAFVRGFGSILELYESDKDDLFFEYEGRDIRSKDASQALTEDWELVLGAMAHAVNQMESHGKT